jgi:hypothetical protein
MKPAGHVVVPHAEGALELSRRGIQTNGPSIEKSNSDGRPRP